MQDAGWFDDPMVPGQLRYWDGAVWTDDVAPMPTAAPMPEPVPEPVGAPAFDAPPPAVVNPLPAFGAPPAFEPIAPVAPIAGAPPVPAGPAPGTWGAPVPVAAAPPAVDPMLVRPGMQIYDPDPPVRRTSIKARGAFAATILGMQATLPLIYSMSALLVGSMLRGNEFDELDFGSSSGAGGLGSLMTFIGLLSGVVGLLCLAASIGVGLRRRWGRLCAMIVETLGLLGVAWTFIQSGSLGSALAAIPPALVLGLVATDDSYG